MRGTPRSASLPPLRSVIEGEIFLHRELWDVIKRQLEIARKEPRGSFYADLVAMVFMTHTLEGYFNFVGDRLAPDFWKKERDHFRRTGFAGKAKKIYELCGRPEPDKTQAPYSTIWLLKKFRDLIAHGHVIKMLPQEIDHPDGVLNVDGDFPNPLTDAVTRDKTEECAVHVKHVIDDIHAAAQPLLPNDDWFRGEALEGLRSYRTRSTSIRA
jgi:hypothetical protein